MHALRLASALALLAAGAPSPGADAPRCSIPDAADWREYRSAHFVLSTDVSRKRAAELVQQLERLHALVVAALFGPDVEVPGTVHVVAFSSAGRYEDVAPPEAAAYVLNDGYRLTVVLPFEGREPVAETIAHELAHHVAWHHFPRQPRWFTEGLAAFVQSVGTERNDDRSAALGSNIVRGQREHGGRWAGYPSPAVARLVSGSLSTGARELLEWKGRIDGDPGRFHAGSWLLYNYLWNKRSSAFTAFQERLANGDDPAAAWRAAFPDLDPASDEAMAKLDAELAGYRRTGRYASYRVDAGAVDATFREAPIASADLHMLLLRIRASSRWPEGAEARKAAVAAVVEEALREDPFQPEALEERASASGASLAAALRPATVARPKDFRAWLALADALPAAADAKEREAALRTAVALAPDDARANNDLAWVLAGSGRAREARPFAERALDLAPWNGGVVDTLAAVAFGLGQCKPALLLQRRAADQFPAEGAGGDGVRSRLAEYEAKCGAAAKAGAAR